MTMFRCGGYSKKEPGEVLTLQKRVLAVLNEARCGGYSKKEPGEVLTLQKRVLAVLNEARNNLDGKIVKRGDYAIAATRAVYYVTLVNHSSASK
ncbi:hypothetical protein LR48_Vigan10g242300 [Vigna angularis]|uniref:Uncharacterized protein n=1 Tax=Phaseolus angularis TaxID=3914 RepID=A0A0L9VNA2_PHAAN|nr:hypothetical protein LR48_Vigan10g242300 [Vigna angularis]